MNIQRISETLMAAGLCEPRRDPDDARRRPLHPTGRGWELADVIARLAAGSGQQLAAALGACACNALVAGLHDLLDHDQDRGLDDRAAPHPETCSLAAIALAAVFGPSIRVAGHRLGRALSSATVGGEGTQNPLCAGGAAAAPLPPWPARSRAWHHRVSAS